MISLDRSVKISSKQMRTCILAYTHDIHLDMLFTRMLLSICCLPGCCYFKYAVQRVLRTGTPVSLLRIR